MDTKQPSDEMTECQVFGCPCEHGEPCVMEVGYPDDPEAMNANTETFDAHNAKCIRCGMPALRDPWLHAERYGHQPQFQYDGKVFQFDTTQGISYEVK